jgi:hypothetical protein
MTRKQIASIADRLRVYLRSNSIFRGCPLHGHKAHWRRASDRQPGPLRRRRVDANFKNTTSARRPRRSHRFGISEILVDGQVETAINRIIPSLKGAFRDRHGRGAGCGGRGRRFDECAGLRTAKSCGPDASTLAFKLVAATPLATVTNKPDHRGEHEGDRKTIARGMPGDPGVTVVTNSRVFFYTRGCGRIERPAFPAPLLG